MNYLTIDNDTLTGLQTFDNVESMNKAIQAHKQSHNLNDTDRAILDAIARYACKYAGVSYLSKQKLAESAGFKSRRTAIRSCQRLEALGIIKQYETRRVKGDKRRSSNIIVIQPIESEQAGQVKAKAGQVTTQSHSQETPFKTNSNNTYDYRPGEKIDKEKLINESIRNNTPAAIVDLLAPYFYGSELYKYIGIIFKAKYHPHIKTSIESNLSAFKATIADVIRRYKSGHICNLDAYLFASIRALSRRLFLENMATVG